MRKALFVALALAGSATVATAATTPSLTCQEVQAVIAQHGGIVLYTGEQTYDRYVVHRGFCLSNQIAKPTYVPARDTRYCPVQTCIDPEYDNNRLFR